MMNNNNETLDGAIRMLQDKQANELKLLLEQFHETLDSLKPINLIKNALHEVSISPDTKMLKNEVHTNMDSQQKKSMQISADSIKSTLLTLVQYAVANAILKNSDAIVNTLENFIKVIFEPKKKLKKHL